MDINPRSNSVFCPSGDTVIDPALSLFPLFAVVQALTWSRGHYSLDALCWLTAGALALAIRFFREPRGIPERELSLTLLLFAVWESYRMARHPTVLYAEPGSHSMAAAVVWVWIACASAFFALVGQLGRWLKRSSAPLLWLAIGATVLSRILILFASPSPHIDVFTIGGAAIDRLFSGLNPYAQVYPDIYAGQFSYVPRLSYPPGYLYLIAPAHKLFGDIRWASIAAEILALIGYYRLAGSKHSGRLGAWVWAAFPMALFVVEQAWVDVLLTPFAVWAMLAIRHGRWGRAGALLGFAVTVKQYAAALLFFAMITAWRSRGIPAVRRFLTSAVCMMAVVLVPWLLWDASSLILGTAGNLLAMSPRKDALSWYAYVFRGGETLSPIWVLAIFGLGLVGGTLFSWRLKEQGWLWGSAFFFLLGFLVSKQAFCNYYSFVAALLWAAWLADRRSSQFSEQGTVRDDSLNSNPI